MTEIRMSIPPEVDHYLEALVRTGPFSSKAELVRAALVSYAQTAGPLAQDFDKENIFSPDGRIYQVEYARESARRGSPIAGAVFDRGVVLGAGYQAENPTLKLAGKIERLSPQVLVAKVGLVADSRTVLRRARRQSWKSADDLLDDLSQYVHEHTLRRDVRPFGCSLLVASTLGKEPRLFSLDPSGSISEAEAEVIGIGAEEVRGPLLQGYRRGKAKEADAFVQKALGRQAQREVVRLDLSS